MSGKESSFDLRPGISRYSHDSHYDFLRPGDLDTVLSQSSYNWVNVSDKQGHFEVVSVGFLADGF